MYICTENRKCPQLVESPIQQKGFPVEHNLRPIMWAVYLCLETSVWRCSRVGMGGSPLLMSNLKQSPYRVNKDNSKNRQMKKIIITTVLMTILSGNCFAQVTAPEPEFINSYCILTSDATYDQLPKESGIIGTHKSKAKKWGKLIGGVASVAGAAGSIGAIGAAHSGSLSGLTTGVKVMSTANSVGSAADIVSGLAGSSGMDIIFKGKHSPYTIKNTEQGVRLIVKAENNERDPMELYRIVRFSTSKKERRIQWMEFESSLIGTDDTKKAGYISFTGHKYGEQSYLITIPAAELEKGEYGIVYMDIATATSVPIGTFSVK